MNTKRRWNEERIQVNKDVNKNESRKNGGNYHWKSQYRSGYQVK